jgi:predicted phosphoribosyltransferase
MEQERFRDRVEAGQLLGRAVRERLRDRVNLIVLALPRGGVPVGFEVARALGTPLDVFIVRKLGVPGHEELAMGAIASGGVRVLNEDVLRHITVSKRAIEVVAAREQAELVRREQSYRGSKPPLDVTGMTVIVVDDGLATGSTMRAAVGALRQMNAATIIVAVPVASAEACDLLRHEAGDVVCLRTPEPFEAVGLWYEDFSQTTDEEVYRLLASHSEISQGKR